MWKKCALFVVLWMASLVFIPTVTALAAPELKVSVSAGLDGKAKYGKGAPVELTIENSGSPFSGDMVIDMPFTYSMGMGEAFPLEIGTGETKTISFVVPKMNDSSGMYGIGNTKTIFFYEGGWKKGTEIAHKGAQQITTTLHAEDSKFGVQFTDNVDRLAALKTVKYDNASNMVWMNSSKIGASAFPNEAGGWGAADFIVIDEYPLADLSVKQQEALIGWVRNGGMMIIGGSDNSHAEAGLFADYLPLKYQGKTEMNTAILNKWAGTEGFEGMIPSYKTKLTPNAQPFLEDEQHVLAAYKQLGEGLVMQTAFSVGDEPLAKMESMTAFWNTLLEMGERTIQVNPMSQPYYYDDPMERIVYSIGDSNELFPSFKVSAPFILGIILFYMIVILPVLYFILKRKDKREYTWWIIPVIAVVTSVAIFAYGAKDRIGRAQIQHTAVLDVGQDGSMTGYYVESLLTNKSGDFVFTAPLETTLFASTRGDDLFSSSSSLPVHKRAMLEKELAGSTVHLRNAGYWDVATVYGKTTLEKMGTYDSQLAIDNKRLTGTVTNSFPFTLTDVAIWSGSTLIPIGDLGPGETVQVDETLKTATFLPRREMFNTSMMAPTHSDDLTKMRKDSMLSFSGEQMNKTEKPVIIGYTDTQLVPIELEQGKPTISSMTMIAQPIEVDVTFENTFAIVPEMMTMSLLSEDTLYPADSLGGTVNEYYFNEPIYLQTWNIPEELNDVKSNWTSFKVSKIQNQLYDVSILNVRTGDYEEQAGNTFTITDKLDDYITAEGEIVLRLILKDARNGDQGRAPELKLNGEVAK